MRPKLETVNLDVDGYNICGIRHRDPNNSNPQKMLCVHGWLDNANSFLPMIPYLRSFDLVAIDLPGCGRSDPIPQAYTMHEMCYQLTRVIQALGWTQCHVVGHSMGASISAMLAVANPAVVKSLVMIDGSGAVSEPDDMLPARMSKALQDRLNLDKFKSRRIASKQSAVDSRLAAAKMTTASARLITDRQVEKDAEGYRWRFDPRWRISSTQYQTEAQVRAILSAIECPTLTVIADDGYLDKRQTTAPRFRCLKQHENLQLPGNHHVHMDTPKPVANAINRFLTTPAL